MYRCIFLNITSKYSKLSLIYPRVYQSEDKVCQSVNRVYESVDQVYQSINHRVYQSYPQSYPQSNFLP